MIETFDPEANEEHKRLKFYFLENANKNESKATRTHIELARNDVEFIDMWGRSENAQTFVTVEKMATESI